VWEEEEKSQGSFAVTWLATLDWARFFSAACLPYSKSVFATRRLANGWRIRSAFLWSKQTGGRQGGAVLAKLSEVLFIETLRAYIAQLPPEQTGWLASARDPEVGKALALLHRNPAHGWTIASLAKGAGISRSVLAERFRHYLNESPMAYLTRWRLQLGAQMLSSTSYSVAQIAADVGYESEAVFNRAFKRQFEVPPARFRNRSRSARGTLPSSGNYTESAHVSS